MRVSHSQQIIYETRPRGELHTARCDVAAINCVHLIRIAMKFNEKCKTRKIPRLARASDIGAFEFMNILRATLIPERSNRTRMRHARRNFIRKKRRRKHFAKLIST